MSHLLPSCVAQLYLHARLGHRNSQSTLQPTGKPGSRVAAEKAGHLQSPEPNANAQGDKVTAWGLLPAPEVEAVAPAGVAPGASTLAAPRSKCHETLAAPALLLSQSGRPTHPEGNPASMPGLPTPPVTGDFRPSPFLHP